MKIVSALMTLAVACASLSSTLEAGEEQTAAVVKPVPMVIEVAAEHEPELISLGEFRLTAYCSCEKCCGIWAENRPVDADGNEIVIGAAGDALTAGYSVAVDSDLIPYGTVILIDGKEYEAQDSGGAIKDKRIDVYLNSHTEALEFGVQYAEIFISEEVY